MDAHADSRVSAIAAAIGEPARARMLIMPGRWTGTHGTELAVVADVSPSTASVHLQRLRSEKLVTVHVQGKHRYYSLGGTNVADALEALSVLAGGRREPFVATAPDDLRAARTCYDHVAGTLGVSLHDRFTALGWLSAADIRNGDYDPTPTGARALSTIGIDVEATQSLRRRFAFPCLDWSERRPHLGGALAAALLAVALKRKWLIRELDSRALHVTPDGRREFRSGLGLRVETWSGRRQGDGADGGNANRG